MPEPTPSKGQSSPAKAKVSKTDFEAASRQFWVQRHKMVQQMPESQFTLMQLSRIPWFLWEAILPSSVLFLSADIAHGYFKGVRTG
jgi:hypothetical protein